MQYALYNEVMKNEGLLNLLGEVLLLFFISNPLQNC